MQQSVARIKDDANPRALMDQDAGPVPFDCTLDFADMRKGWSVWKKRWCCAKKQIGCMTAISGTFHVCNLEYDKVLEQTTIHRDVDQAVQTAIFLTATGSKDGGQPAHRWCPSGGHHRPCCHQGVRPA